jgi:hypothetical protein
MYWAAMRLIIDSIVSYIMLKSIRDHMSTCFLYRGQSGQLLARLWQGRGVEGIITELACFIDVTEDVVLVILADERILPAAMASPRIDASAREKVIVSYVCISYNTHSHKRD